jgi:plastocyanin
MKTLLSLFIAVFGVISQAQETYNITWLMGISHEDASVTLTSGDTVIWTWGENGMPHDVSSIDPDAPSDFGSEILIGMGQTYQYTFVDPAEIDYRCSVHPNNMTGTITVLPQMSVEDKFVKNFNYFPSVVTEKLTVTSLIPMDNYEIYDAQGKKVASGNLSGKNVYEINTSGFASGVYIVKVMSSTKVNTSFRIVKQ